MTTTDVTKLTVGQPIEAYHETDREWDDAIIADIVTDKAIIVMFSGQPGYYTLNGDDAINNRFFDDKDGSPPPKLTFADAVPQRPCKVLVGSTRKSEIVTARILAVVNERAIIARWMSNSRPVVVVERLFGSHLRTDVPDALASFEPWQKVEWLNHADNCWVPATVKAIYHGVTVTVLYDVDGCTLPIPKLTPEFIRNPDDSAVDPNTVAVGQKVRACYDGIWWDASVVQRLIGPHLQLEFGAYNVMVPAAEIHKRVRLPGGSGAVELEKGTVPKEMKGTGTDFKVSVRPR